jgi:hypothetical protein
MEVFIHNVPIDLTCHGFNRELQPFMRQLQIRDFLCEKPKKKRFGTVTFLNTKDGGRFLAVHGQQEEPRVSFLHRPRLVSNLQLMGVAVYCKESKHPPRSRALGTLEYDAEQRANGIRERPGEPVVFDMKNFSCGRCDFVGDQLTYSPEVWWTVKGSIQFKKRTMIVDMEDRRRIRVPRTAIVGLVYSADGTLTATLSNVPFFFELTPTSPDILAAQVSISRVQGPFDGPSRWRRCSLGEGHAQVMGQCLVYQFKVVPGDFMKKIARLREGELTMFPYTLPIARLPLAPKGLTLELQKLQIELAECTKCNHLPFGVLFQLQALAQNAYLHPAMVLHLCRLLQPLFALDKAAGVESISVDSMRKLFNMINWPFPNDDPSDYDAESLVAILKQNHREIQESIEYREGLFNNTPSMARIYRINVTPTRITLHGPEMEPQNRILRKFPNHHEYFIRVQFCDENGEDLMLSSRVSYSDIFTRYKEVMKTGIQIAGRTYKFLGFSHSSLRSHSVWVSTTSTQEAAYLV